MHRRALLASPALAAPLLAAAARPAAAQGAPPLATEEFMVPARDAGIELYVRNKRPEPAAPARPDRTVLFVHGGVLPAHTMLDLPLGGVSWMDYIAGRGFDVWCMDVRGYGRSTRPPEMAQPPEANPPAVRGEVALADVAAVAAFIRQRRGLPRLVHMGFSWGTTLMARFAAENPTLVERLVLYAPFWVNPAAATTPAGSPPPAGAYRGVTVEAARRGLGAGAPEAKRGGLVPPGWFEHWSGVTWATDPEGMRQTPPVLRLPNGSGADIREYWAAGRPWYDPSRITAPTLVVLGEWDAVTPPGMATALFPLLVNAPGKRLVMLGEGTHAMWMERNRGALFQAVQVFLEEAAGS